MVPTQGELGWPDGGEVVGVRKDVVITAVAHGLPNVLDEAAEIKEAFGERAKLLQDCSVDALDEALQDCTVWFFAGHGASLQDERVLAFASADGEYESISIDALAELVWPHVTRGLGLVVLTGCCTSQLAIALRDLASVPCVVCWETLVADEAARAFGRELACKLSSDVDIELAFSAARTAVTCLTEQGNLNGWAGQVQKFELADPRDASRVHQERPNRHRLIVANGTGGASLQACLGCSASTGLRGCPARRTSSLRDTRAGDRSRAGSLPTPRWQRHRQPMWPGWRRQDAARIRCCA